jgi:hypothetical protein
LTNSSGLYAIEDIKEIITARRPEIISNVNITRGENTLEVTNIVLRAPGLVWGYITTKFNGIDYDPGFGEPSPH